jgi:hypothetical protein
MVAGADGDQEGAIALLEEQVAVSTALGYRRGLMTGLGGLGEAQMHAGKLEESEQAFIKAISIAESMGITVEMLGFMVSTAQVWSMGREREGAVEILASVIADPESEKQNMSQTSSVRDRARGLLSGLKPDLAPDVFEEAVSSGAATSFETVAKRLTDTLR